MLFRQSDFSSMSSLAQSTSFRTPYAARLVSHHTLCFVKNSFDTVELFPNITKNENHLLHYALYVLLFMLIFLNIFVIICSGFMPGVLLHIDVNGGLLPTGSSSPDYIDPSLS